MLCLVDCDPYGMEIYGCYKYGSKAEREAGETGFHLTDITFIGLTFEDLQLYHEFQDGDRRSHEPSSSRICQSLQYDHLLRLSDTGSGALLPLNRRDISKCKRLLEREWVKLEPNVKYVICLHSLLIDFTRLQLETMDSVSLKSEIQGIAEVHHSLADWLIFKIRQFIGHAQTQHRHDIPLFQFKDM